MKGRAIDKKESRKLSQYTHHRSNKEEETFMQSLTVAAALALPPQSGE